MQPSKTFDVKMLGQAFSQLAHKLDGAVVEKLAGDASSRHYYRVLDRHGSKYVLQVSEVFKSSEEHPFLLARKILEKIGVPVPHLHGVVPEQGWILLEDLGDETLQNVPTIEFYKEAINLIVDWAEKASPTSTQLDEELRSKAPHFQWAFDLEKLQFEMGFTDEHLFKKYLKKTNLNFLQLVEGNSRWLADSPRVFCHRDFHSRNLMVHEQKLFVIDFQDARMGPLSYDLVSLLWDPYVKISEAWRSELLAHWHKRSAAVVKKLATLKPGHDFAVEMERMKLQRLLKAAGSYASFYNNKGRKDYLPHITPAIKDACAALATLQRDGHASSAEVELLTVLRSMESEISDIIKNT